ncbi:MAG: glycoside hydrolase domain-containing protein [Bryobacteraceae bacterium]
MSLRPDHAGTPLLIQWFKRFLGIIVPIIVVGAALVLSRPISPRLIRSAPLAVWTASSLQRIGPTDPSGAETRVQLFAALGESESFQIVAGAPDSNDIRGLNVAVSDLTGPAGQVISKSNFQLYREHYVYIGPNQGSANWHGSNQPLGPGWYPDGLIPFVDPSTGAPLSGAPLTAVPYDVPAGKNQPFWIDISVPRLAVPGQYTGTYTVRSRERIVSGQILLKVWNFALPRQPSLVSSFLISKSRNQATFKELLRHRLMPDSVPQALQPELIDEYGLGATSLNLWGGASYGHCSMAPPPPVETIRKAASAQHSSLLLYNYSADEVDRCKELFPAVKQWAQNLHAAGIMNLVTMGPIPQLFDDGSQSGRSAVDIWPILPDTYDSDLANVQRALQKGDQVWSYNTEVQDAYSPKWEIDFAPINFRIQPGFINQSLHLTGLLYWCVDRWSADPWNDVVFKDGNGTFPGDGELVYPGSPVGVAGVVPSMRLKWLRDGVDDYDYIQMLKQAGYGDWAMQIATGVGPDWTHWTRDPNVLEAARLKFGQMLDRLATQPNVQTARSGGDARVH